MDFPDVHQIHDPAAVNAVAGKAVGMPRQNALGFAFLNLVKYGALRQRQPALRFSWWASLKEQIKKLIALVR